MTGTARKEDFFLDKKLIIPENRLDAIRIMARLHPVVGDQPTNEKDQPNTNNPVLDLACTILNIHEKGVGVHADLRKIQDEPPKYFFGKGFMSGISSLKGNGILAVYGQWRDGSGRYAIKQFYYTDKEIIYRNAISDTAWSGWIDILTSNSELDYNKLLNVPITSTLSDDKNKISSIFAVNQVNRAAVNAQKTANTADAKAVDAMNEAKKRVLPIDVAKEYLSTGGDYLYVGSADDFPAGTLGLYNGNPSSNNHTTDLPFTGLQWVETSKIFYSETQDRRKQFAYTYTEPRAAFRVKRNNDIFSEWAEWWSTYNTKNIKGFLRVEGNLIPLTEDQLTSSLDDYKDRAASIYIVNQVNRAAVNAQKTANTADAKAVDAMNEAKRKVSPEHVKNEFLKNPGSYTTTAKDVPELQAGDSGLALSGKFIVNNPGLDFDGTGLPSSFLYYEVQNTDSPSGNVTAIFRGYNSPLLYIATKRNGQKWSPPSKIFGSHNTTTSKDGFVRASGTKEPLTEDQRTSTLQDSDDLVSTIGAVNGVNRTAKNAEKIALDAFSKVKPITEGGTGATTAVTARKNLGLKAAAERDVAASLDSNRNTLVPLSLLQDSTLGLGQKWVDVTNDRVSGTTYTNNTGKPIMMSVWSEHSALGSKSITVYIDGMKTCYADTASGTDVPINIIIPNGSSYRVELVVFILGTHVFWMELR